MQYRLRTLVVATVVLPPLIGILWRFGLLPIAIVLATYAALFCLVTQVGRTTKT